MATSACPHCGTIQLVPNPAPVDLVCVACRRPLRPGPPPAQVAAGPLPPHVRSAPPVKQATVVPPPIPHGRPPPIPTASPPASGKAAAAGEADDAPPPKIHRRRGMWYELVLFGGLFCIVVGGLGFASYLMLQRGDVAVSPEHKDRDVVVQAEEDAPSKLADLWADGSRRSLRKNGMKVRLEEVEYFPIYGYDENRRLIRLGDKPYLKIIFNVTNQWARSQRYTPWYGNTFEVEGRTTGAMLWDDQGREYAVQIFTDVPSLQGQQFECYLEKNQELNDLLIFDVPEGVDLLQVKSWRLQLPASAVGQVGAYRFEIPVGMLKFGRSP